MRKPARQNHQQRVEQAHQPHEQRRVVLEEAAVHRARPRSANSAWRAATNAANSRRNRSRRKPRRVGAAGACRDSLRIGLECAHAGGDRLRRLLGEQYAGRRRGIESADRFQRAAAAVGDHRRAVRLRFQRRDAEILLGGKHERARRARASGRARRPARGRAIVTLGPAAARDARRVPGPSPITTSSRSGSRRNAATIRSTRLYGTKRDTVTYAVPRVRSRAGRAGRATGG